MTDVFAGSFTIDLIAPAVSNQFPAPAAVGVPASTTVSFRVTDTGGSGVDLNSLNVTIGGQAAIAGGVGLTGFSATITPVSLGYDVSIARVAHYNNDTVYTVVVNAADSELLPNAMTPASWSFHTSVGVFGHPLVVATGLDSVVYVSWIDLGPVNHYELRRSLVDYPRAPTDGQLLYSGTGLQYVDTNVVNDNEYFYTIFVVAEIVNDAAVYLAYTKSASDDAYPRLPVPGTVEPGEYVPARGELGDTANPLPSGKTVRVWGAAAAGIRQRHDTIEVPDNVYVRSPVTGLVVSRLDSVRADETLALSRLYIEGDSQILYILDGFLATPNITPGTRLGAGQVIGNTVAGEVTFALTKLAAHGFPDRSIRPAYFYVTTERREGRR
jgi:hypothetical protein